jgi:membrane protein DedA with SNARE-associated domain
VLRSLGGTAPLLIICALLYAEEAGVPIPFAPGEAVLLGAGLLIASGTVPFWLAMPAEFIAVLAGALTGYAWSRAIGAGRLRQLADRLGAGKPFDRVTERLREAGVLQIAGSRLVPGLRIYTTLAAGAVGVSLWRFVLGVVPAAALWVTGFTLLGVFVGIPAQRVLGRFEAFAVRLGVVLVLLAAAYVVINRIPWIAGNPRRSPEAPRWRLVVAAIVDLLLVAVAMFALGLLTGLEALEPDSVVSAATVVGILSLVYLVIARRSIGLTAGEALLRIHYP